MICNWRKQKSESSQIKSVLHAASLGGQSITRADNYF